MHFSPLEFHLTKAARDTYGLARDLVQYQKPDLTAVQELALRMNERAKSVRPGELYALVILQQTFHRVIELYRLEKQPRLFDLAMQELTERLGETEAERLLESFAAAFPPLPVYQEKAELKQFLRTYAHGRANRDATLEQMILVHVNNGNSAVGGMKELFDEHAIPAREIYAKAMQSLRTLVREQPTYGKLGLTLFDLLESPFKASPGSLAGQLRFIVEQWGLPLGDDWQRLLLLAEDLLREEDTRRGPPGPGFVSKIEAWTPKRGAEELPERYTADTEWMPRAVLIAKSVYVWLDQLSKEYRREIKRLDQIPDEELAKLAGWGFTALWLIGLWERSHASERIKHLHGNIEAAASAYSLYDYTIAAELGGEAALDNLRERAFQHGIRLACDVVPNHMGIDSRWVIEHPDWFLQLDHPPYPAYRFTGPDLSPDPRVSIRLEDGYWNQTDAAVVFERRDNWTGETRYIYHGNDGTQMPWNDTAQLNFLLPDVREAMIQLILSVAHKFSLIRFDAAMTLTKRHYQRLWFPEPGTGGAIPSRAWYGMTKEEFERAMPTEFWRDLVDRVNAEKPDTLLLAEAFWLTEGLFVRTLGMHRVYNSAFMNMLKQEKNAEFRQILRNVLTYDPRILERYVNFMNNPDEDSAIEQFGTDDKYFGVAMMMSTLPGLPMFGHGQIEGYREKYGHEYRRAYYEETPDQGLVERHEREIFPLLRQRRLFSQTQAFALHDFVTTDGYVNQDVYAYTNRSGFTHTLAVFHNRYAETRGWVRQAHDGRTLASELHLHPRANMFCIWRDLISGLEYIEQSDRLVQHGFYLELRAFAYHVFSAFREVEDREGRYRRVAERLQGQGTSSIEREVRRITLEPLIRAFSEFASAETFRALYARPDGVHYMGRQGTVFFQQACDQGNFALDPRPATAKLERLSGAVVALGEIDKHMSFEDSQADIASELEQLLTKPNAHQPLWRVLAGWLAVAPLGELQPTGECAKIEAHWMDDWFLRETLADTFAFLGAGPDTQRETELVHVLAAHHQLATTFDRTRRHGCVSDLLYDPVVRHFLHTHTYRGVEWFNKEAFEELLTWLKIVTVVGKLADDRKTPAERAADVTQCFEVFHNIADLAAVAEYQVKRFVELLGYAAKRQTATAG